MSERFRLLVAVHLFLWRDQQVLLLRRFNTGYADGQYSVPAGHLDGGEEFRAAMRREAREEIGIDIASDDLEVVGAMHRRAAEERIDFFFSATRWSGTVTNAEPHKCDELRWCAVDSLPPNVIPYVRRALDNVRQRKPFDSFGFAEFASHQHA